MIFKTSGYWITINKPARSASDRCHPALALRASIMGFNVRMKICGITDEEDGRQAGLLGGDCVGLNFYPPSPRHVSEEKAARIIQHLPPFVEPVGLFVNEPLADVVEQVRR